jgi:hypothetical protein
MWYLSKPIETWTETDLLKLIEDKVPESRQLDYKSQLPAGMPKDRTKFLANVSAFANADGGLLVFGVEEDEGVPTALVGVPEDDAEKVKLALEHQIRDGLDPTILDVRVVPVRLTSGSHVFLIRVPRSLNAPHMVIFDGHRQFYMRHSGGKQPMDVTELRQSFLQGEHRIQQIKSFRAERLALIRANEGPVPLVGQAKICLQIIPLAPKDVMTGRDLNEIQMEPEFHENFGPLDNNQLSTHQRLVNFDGILCYARTEESWVPDHLKGNSTVPVGYVQLFRDGTIEAVDSLLLERWQAYPTSQTEGMLLMALPHYLQVQKFLGNGPPFYLAISLIGVGGLQICNPLSNFREQLPHGRLDRRELLLPEVAITDWEVEPTEIFKPIFYSIWNAFGASRCLLYNSAGVWPKQ